MSLHIDLQLCLCLDLFGLLDDSSVETIITDPPYAASEGSDIEVWNYKTIDEDWDRALPDPAWYAEAFRVLKPGGAFLHCGSIHNMEHALTKSREAGFILRQEIIWQKTNPVGSMRKFLTFAHESIWWFTKPGAPYTFNRVRDEHGRVLTTVWTIATPGPREKLYDAEGNVLHPTQKPLELARRLVESFTNRGDLVVDPYAGTGTFLAYALRAGRDIVGCDITEKYYTAALARLRKEQDDSRFRDLAFPPDGLGGDD